MKNTRRPTIHRKKGELPTKQCATCGRPFEWRKRWERNWDDVRYCSERCRNARPRSHENVSYDGRDTSGPYENR